LRDNPGGSVTAAVEVSDAFLDGGVALTTDGPHEDDDLVYLVGPGDETDGLPLVVLVNGGTASSAEILAGALRDHGRGILVGERTYGKGLIQKVLPLRDGRSLKLSTASYRLPSGAAVHERGIDPDIWVDAEGGAAREPAGAIPEPSTDRQLDRAIQLLRGRAALAFVSAGGALDEGGQGRWQEAAGTDVPPTGSTRP
jgi:carboxyl-terminal processing protease